MEQDNLELEECNLTLVHNLEPAGCSLAFAEHTLQGLEVDSQELVAGIPEFVMDILTQADSLGLVAYIQALAGILGPVACILELADILALVEDNRPSVEGSLGLEGHKLLSEVLPVV